MSTGLVVVPIVEGHGEVEAVPELLRRLVPAVDPAVQAQVLAPLRVQKGKLLKVDELERHVDLAARKAGEKGAVLVLLDADDDCAAELGPQLLARAARSRPDALVSVVLAVREFETWFLAAAQSLQGRRGLSHDLAPPDYPESIAGAKEWLRQRARAQRYRPTIDQAALAATFDLVAARAASPSFDKMWREVARLVREAGSS
ncbi:MAG: DUF4276 family protein [Actinomycetota bacterium]|nr:DUF4276 family protein [Actinomycetota bacterium]